MLSEGLSRYLTNEQLAKLAAVRVGIAGAGGLGSNCAMMLARCGVRQFVIADYDTVEPSNLNRQFFFSQQVALPKVEALRENLLRIDETLALDCQVMKLEPESVQDVFAGCEIVVEALDGVDDKKMMAQAFLPTDAFLVSASGMAGWGGDPMTSRKVRDDMVIVGDFTRDIATLPPLAPRVMMAAAMQADAVIERILGPCCP